MASSPPPKKPKSGVPAALDVSRLRIDDPTAAFPIGSLDEPDELDPDAVSPVSADQSPPPKKPKKAAKAPAAEPAPPVRTPAPAAAPSPLVVAGIDLRWLAASLLAGAALAVFVVGLFGLVVILVRQ